LNKHKVVNSEQTKWNSEQNIPGVAATDIIGQQSNPPDPSFVEQVAELNMRNTLKSIPEQSPILMELVKEGKLVLIGAMYEVETGAVRFYEDEMIANHTFQNSEAEVL
jgi:carbonic anhydrase